MGRTLHKYILRLIAAITVTVMTACSSPPVPVKWRGISVVKTNLVRVEEATNSHGLYLEYKGLSRDVLLQRATASLLGAGYKKAGIAFDGTVLGFSKGTEQLAVKVDQFGETLYLAIFDEGGKEPLLHGVVFGKYTVSGVKPRPEAAKMFAPRA